MDYGAKAEDILNSIREQADDAINRVLEILQNRVDQFGVSEPTIQKQGNRRIIVELAGIQDSERARALLQSTAQLEFFMVKSPEVTNDILSQIDKAVRGDEELEALAAAVDGEQAQTEDGELAVSNDQTISISELFGDDGLSSEDAGSGDTAVVVDQNIFQERPFSSMLRALAIVLDKKVHMAPSIRTKITDGGTLIEGFANMDEAKDIAIVLRAGALPAPVKIIEERIVGPSLGADSVKKGTYSVLLGLTLILVFIPFYYKLSGIIADFALIWNILLVLAVLASLGATLTLPGIAALILTVGMSVDANVIIFERIREESRKGKTPRTAIDSGYARALTTIIDANVTTLVAALVLYQFGTGPIRGFATVLFWGIIISMFTAIFVTRTIFNSFTERKGLEKLSI